MANMSLSLKAEALRLSSIIRESWSLYGALLNIKNDMPDISIVPLRCACLACFVSKSHYSVKPPALRAMFKFKSKFGVIEVSLIDFGVYNSFTLASPDGLEEMVRWTDDQLLSWSRHL